MSLQAKLDTMREQFESKMPAETLAMMHGATDDLLASGIMDGVLKAGDHAPDFALNDQDDKQVRASALMSDGPLVVSFYRGVW
jgi:hypothetical protein